MRDASTDAWENSLRCFNHRLSSPLWLIARLVLQDHDRSRQRRRRRRRRAQRQQERQRPGDDHARHGQPVHAGDVVLPLRLPDRLQPSPRRRLGPARLVRRCVRLRQRPVPHAFPARRRRRDPDADPARVRDRDLEGRLDLRVHGRPVGRRHRPLPRQHRRRGAEVVPDDGDRRRDARRHR